MIVTEIFPEGEQMKRHFRPKKLALISSHLWYLVCVKGEGHQETCQVRLQAPDPKTEGIF